MAIWQFNLALVPRQSIVETYGLVPEQVGNSRANWWQNRAISPIPVIEFMDGFLPGMWVSKTSQGWGNSMTNDVGLYWNEATGHIAEFGFRLDLRDDFTPFLSQLLQLCEQLNCLLMDRKGRLIEPVFEEVYRLIEGSNPEKFVHDPKQFIEDFAKGIIKPE